MGRISDSDVRFVPVIATGDEELLDEVLSTPFSYMSTAGPVWRSTAGRERYIKDERKSHLVVCLGEDAIGAVTWQKGYAPGFFQVELHSSDDGAWQPELVEAAMKAAMGLLLRTSEARRVEFLVGTYNNVVLSYLTSTSHFEVEGVLRDRYFIDGRFWPGVVCRADLEAFDVEEQEMPKERDVLLSKLRKKAVQDLGAQSDALA